MKLRFIVPLAALVLALALGTAVPARASLAGDLNRALASSGVPWSLTGAVALDLRNGGTAYARNQGRSLRPASNEKLAVALAALVELGPNFRIPTRVYGRGARDGAIWRGALFLKGYGDPSLNRVKLARLADRLYAAGLRRVTGAIVGDESFFDRRRMAPGWKASYYKLECPPLSALIANRGKIGRRTLDNPALLAAQWFRTALIARGIAVPRKATLGVAPEDATLLAGVVGHRVAALVRTMNLGSDNFIAEMLTKGLGAHELGAGTTAGGTTVMRRVLRARGVPLAGVRLVDGSGLSDYDRMTAISLAALLISAWSDPAIDDHFVRSLPVAGVSGTLEERLESWPAYGRVRAKTGTTNRSSALAGYVGTRYVFAILHNGNPVRWTPARRGQDRFVQILARRL